jgi:peptidoglycan/LPS O-acetylase OafA/YrhL
MQQRLDHIHGLRGVAALVVVIQHACQLVQDAGAEHYRLMLDTINLGRFGVVLFFLISGLVIPFSFRGEAPLRHFAISRVFRLYPVYWLSIPVLAYVALFRGAHIDFAIVVSNLTMLQGLWGGPNIGPGYWTLGYEMGFYILCAVLFAARLLANVALNGAIVLMGLALAVVPVLQGNGGQVTNAPFFIAMFFLGMLLRRAFVDQCPSAWRWSVIATSAAMIAALLLSGWVVAVPENGNSYLRPMQLGTGMVLPIAVFIAVLWLKPKPPRAIMYLGTISYSLYLFQDVALIFLREVVPPGQWPVGYVLAVLGVTAAIAALVYRFVELPMIAVGRRFAEWAGETGKAPATR